MIPTNPFDNLLAFMEQLGPDSGRTTKLGSLVSLISPQAPSQPQQQANPLPAASVESVPTAKPQVEPQAAYVPGDVGDPTAPLEPHQKAFLNGVSVDESKGRYDVRYTPAGGMRFTDMSKHPNIPEPGPDGPSTAAGRYQITGTTWNALGGGPFDPLMQDTRAWQLASSDYNKRTGKDLDTELKANGFTPEIAKALAPTWPTLKNPKNAMSVYDQSLKKYEENPTPPVDHHSELINASPMLNQLRAEKTAEWGLPKTWQGTQNSQALSDDVAKIIGHDNTRAAGMDMLKNGMWKQMGMDYIPDTRFNGIQINKFDDSPVPSEKRKSEQDLSVPTVDKLKRLEQEMEMNTRKRYGDKYQELYKDNRA
jgi:muramidase (phage lysozyme)